jgi:hypothetical protein
MPIDGKFSFEDPHEDLEPPPKRRVEVDPDEFLSLPPPENVGPQPHSVEIPEAQPPETLESPKPGKPEEEEIWPDESILVEPPSPESGPETPARTIRERVAEFVNESLENLAEKAVFVGAEFVIPGAGTALERTKKLVELAQAAEDFFKNKPVKLELPIVMNEGSLVGFDMTARLFDGEVQEVGVVLDVFPAGIDSDTPGVEPAEEDEESGGEAVDGSEASDDPRTPDESPEQRPEKDSFAVPESEDPPQPSEVADDAEEDRDSENVEFRPEREIGLGCYGGSYALAGDTRPRLRPVPRLELPEDEPVVETAAVVGDLALLGVRLLDADRMLGHTRRRVFARLYETESPETLERALDAMESLRTVLFVDTVSKICVVVHIDPVDGVAYCPLLIRIEREISGPIFASGGIRTY